MTGITDFDILADLEGAPRRPKGNPCRIAEMRRDRPDLVPQWERVIPERRYAPGDISAWFTAREFPMTRNVVERHRKTPQPCSWCRPGREIVA